MRKTLLFPLGALTGACLTLLVSGPHGGLWAARAAAGADDAYRESLRLAHEFQLGEEASAREADLVDAVQVPSIVEDGRSWSQEA